MTVEGRSGRSHRCESGCERGAPGTHWHAAWETPYQAHPRRTDWRRVAEVAGIVLGGIVLSLILWVCWLVYATSLKG